MSEQKLSYKKAICLETRSEQNLIGKTSKETSQAIEQPPTTNNKDTYENKGKAYENNSLEYYILSLSKVKNDFHKK